MTSDAGARMRMDGEPVLFALAASRRLGEAVAESLGVPLAAHEEREFEDGEHKARPLENVRGRDVYLLDSLYGEPGASVNDKLCRLLFFLGALRDAHAARVTAVLPYLCYARKDRKTKTRDPVTTRYLAQLLEAVGVDRVVTVDVHNLAAFQNAFRCRTDHLEARRLLVEHYVPLLDPATPVTVVSPDVGGVKRAEALREALAQRLDAPVGVAFMEKLRSEGVVSGDALVGEVAERTVVIVDDLISTGTTVARAVAACHAHGAGTIHACATHGLFVGAAEEMLANPRLERLTITDTVPPFRLDPALVRERVCVLPIAPLLAGTIECLHRGGSVAALLATG